LIVIKSRLVFVKLNALVSITKFCDLSKYIDMSISSEKFSHSILPNL